MFFGTNLRCIRGRILIRSESILSYPSLIDLFGEPNYEGKFSLDVFGDLLREVVIHFEGRVVRVLDATANILMEHRFFCGFTLGFLGVFSLEEELSTERFAGFCTTLFFTYFVNTTSNQNP